MTANNLVTIWHRCGDAFEKNCYKANILLKVSLDKNGIKEKGLHYGTMCEIRIPSQKDIGASLGDYAGIGSCSDNEPDLRRDFKVIELSDNRRGGSPHFKIVAVR